MKLSLCTISFRHHLHSLDQLARWAQTHQFQGIELWGIHAKHLSAEPHYNEKWLKTYGLHTSMISDYLPLEVPLQETMIATNSLSALGHIWGTTKLRTFAGQKASAETTKEERVQLVKRLYQICDYLYKEGQYLLVETHPNTLTDNLPSTLQLLEEVDHPALRVNFDVLHMWESGTDPLEAVKKLQPFISHFHFKNIASRNQLHVFNPHNVYAAAGSREGMVPLFEGEIDYDQYLTSILSLMEVEASLEWFGRDVKTILEMDAKRVWEVTKKLQRVKVG
ncbi:sugar phosphate isomerase/epimerase family protein [Sutcliffiella halmapala]|uniref:sugar phosphate isomerase/epimerase family protein n=1 Tax=Sutcliffiella halmapala TaxID=79882 RepID=UPI000994E7C0|nr:sugar phosphate isomerase/epimerase [Sutcliffiella halmapala]